MIRLLTIITIILSIILFPPATLAVISNDAVPGDATYPIKRFLEEGIFAIASITPTTKAWFAAARSDRRFQEVTVLINRGKPVKDSLNELVEQTKSASKQIAEVKGNAQKKQLVDKLSESIEKYDKGLKDASGKKQIAKVSSPSPTPPRSTNQHKPLPVQTPVPSQSPKFTPTPAPTTSYQPTQPSYPSDPSQQEIEEARRRLEEIRRALEEEARRLEEERQQQLQESPTPSPTQTPKPTHEPTPTPKPISTLIPTLTLKPTPTPSGHGIFRLFSQPGNDKDFIDVSSTPSPTPEASCQTDCKYCPTSQTCGASTYDTCTDNLGRKSADTAFCTDGASGFRCYAKDNTNCQSADEGVYNYSCSACPVSSPQYY
ncbi:hypothetical protein HYT18_01850 [Candidatus Microgenomates bacterium]|nr:hypothetical protein [Candidatus Microgenomates bacterium]